MRDAAIDVALLKVLEVLGVKGSGVTSIVAFLEFLTVEGGKRRFCY